MQVILYGVLKEKLQREMLELAPVATVSELKQTLELQFPLLKEQRYSIAVNKKICTDNQQPLMAGDIIALLPPFSGG